MKDLDNLTASVRRLEDQRFVTGTGTFIDDVNLPGQAWAAILRSTRAHARINGIDTSKARAAPGVLLVITGKHWVAAGHGPIPTKSVVRTKRDGSLRSTSPSATAWRSTPCTTSASLSRCWWPKPRHKPRRRWS